MNSCLEFIDTIYNSDAKLADEYDRLIAATTEDGDYWTDADEDAFASSLYADYSRRHPRAVKRRNRKH